MSEFSLEKKLYRWRVRAGFLGIIVTIIIAKPSLLSLLTAMGICSLALILRTWAAGHLKKEKELTISGPYQYSRNPLYLGNVIIGISVVIGARSFWVLIIFVGYFLLFYPAVIRRENERMKKLFPQEYRKYMKKVPLFVPSFKGTHSSLSPRFSWELYRKNKEWRALLGGIIFWLALVLKMIIF